MGLKEFDEQVARYIETQREYSRRLNANEPPENLAELREQLDSVEAEMNFFDAHGNKLTGEGLVKLVDEMQDDYKRTLDINSPFIFVSTNSKTPKIFAMNAKSTGAGDNGKVELSLDTKQITEAYYNQKYRPDDLKVFEKPQEPGIFSRIYNWFHKQFNDGIESDTFREYDKALRKYNKMHHFHTREIQPQNNGKMNWEVDNIPEMPDRTKMSEEEYEVELKKYNDAHEFTPKPQEYYDKGCFEILKKVGYYVDMGGEELEGDELEKQAEFNFLDKEGEIALSKDLGEEIIDKAPTVAECDKKLISERVHKMGESFYEKPEEEWTYTERENLRDFKEGLMALYTRDDFGKNMVMNVSDDLLEQLYDFYQDDFTMVWHKNAVEDIFEQVQKNYLDQGKSTDYIVLDVPNNEPQDEGPVYW